MPPQAAQQPTHVEISAVIGLYQGGQFDAALEQARRLTARYPQHSFGWQALGAMLREQGACSEAIPPLRRAAQLADDAESHNNLGLALQDAGDLAQAEASYQTALRRRADLVEAHANLGRLYHSMGRLADARARLLDALALRPDLAEAHNSLAAVLQDSGQFAAAESSCRRAISLKPDYVDAHTMLGAILSGTGRIAEAEAAFRKALELRPHDMQAHSNLLFNLNYAAQGSPQAGLDEARRYGRSAGARVPARFTRWQGPATPQRLRVGLVSADLRQHPVGHFLDGLLAQLDRSRLEVFAYPTHFCADPLAERLRGHCAHWSPLYGRSDAEAARLIHADGVHVLIDLSGHTAHNRLPVFAFRPAPVQASWLGYFATTGVDEIDYLLADPVSVPAEHRSHFSEAIWYLPETRLCFTPPADAPPVAPPPALGNGSVTFGNFQNLSKLNDEVLALWARVLTALPTTRLRLQNKQLADREIGRLLGQRLRQAGIDPARVALHGPQPRESYLAAYAEVDLMLDTFPFPGGTTTCEALYMGVPTVTLAGDRLIGRQGASLLAAAGLSDWIATDAAQFVDVAVSRAGDPAALAALRAGLRTKVLASPLFDAPRFARHLEEALWGMWRRGPRSG